MKGIKKLISVSLCTALIGSGAAAVLPQIDSGVGIVASAAAWSKYEVNDDDTITVTGYGGTADIVLPSTIDGKRVTAIGDYAFCGNGIRSIVIPSGVLKIGKGAFDGCTGLESIDIPDTVVSVGENAFDTTAWYKNLDDGIVYIGKVLYKYKGTMPTNTSVVIKKGTVSIGYSAFDSLSNCKGMTSVTIPNSVTEICDHAFGYCTNLSSITIPDSVTKIGEYAFSHCWSLTDIIIPNSVTSIGESAFTGCEKLISISIPDSVTSIGTLIFLNTPALESIDVDENNSAYSSVDGVLFNKNKTELILCPQNYNSNYYSVPDGVLTIQDEAFYNMQNIQTIMLPESVISIGYGAFSWCKNTKNIFIPESVTSIKNNAFNKSDATIKCKQGSYAETYAKDNNIPYEAVVFPLYNKSTISKTSVPQNTSVFVKGAATGGEGEYKYAFYYKKSTSAAWQTIGELYGKTTEVSFVPATVAKYLVKVNVKDETGKIVTKIFEVDSTKPTGDDLVNKSTLDKTTTQRNAPVTITGAASGGAGDYKYAFYYKKTTSKAFTPIGTEYGDAATATFTPASTADYNVRINVKDSNGTIVTKQYKVTATSTNTALTNNSTVSAASVTKGTDVKLTGKASGGTSPYKYAFYYKKSTSAAWTKIGTEFTTASTASFTPAVKATYNVKIVVKDNTGKTAEKTFTVTSN